MAESTFPDFAHAQSGLREDTMHIRPIRTDADHRRALAEIEQLWGAADGTPAA
jgi:hypothetical protein